MICCRVKKLMPSGNSQSGRLNFVPESGSTVPSRKLRYLNEDRNAMLAPSPNQSIVFLCLGPDLLSADPTAQLNRIDANRSGTLRGFAQP